MATFRPFNRTFLRGLQTTRPSDGADDFTGFRRFQNVRTHKDEAEIRPGRVPLQALEAAQTGAAFTGGYGLIQNSARIWSIAMAKWTCDGLFFPTSVASGTIIDQGGALRVGFNSGVLEAKVEDTGAVLLSSAAPLGAGQPHYFSVVRDGLTMSLYIEDVLNDQATLTQDCVEFDGPDFQIGTGFSGTIDFLRFREGVHAANRPRVRLLNPRSRCVRACYRNGPDAAGLIWDHSINERHARISGSVAEGLSYAHPHMPVQAMRTFIADEGKRKMFVLAGGREFGGDI